MNRFGEQEAKCPFFLKLDTGRKRIICEGVADYCNTALCFGRDPKKMFWHKQTYCDRSYRYCEIYRMLEEKYRDD